MTDIVDKLRRMADGYEQAALEELARYGEGTDDQYGMEDMAAVLSVAADEITLLRSRNALLRVALEPFAADAAMWSADIPDAVHPYMTTEDGDGDALFSIGDLRRAALALRVTRGE